MSKSQVRWGILGTSPISETMAKAIQASDTSQLVAIGSRSLHSAKQFSDQFALPKFYAGYQQLLQEDDIDALYLGLPNHLHKEWTIRCLRAGKNVLCEKPFVVNVQEAKEVISVVEQSNIFCMEALMYRYHPFTIKLQELIRSKLIGDIKLYQATYTANIASVANPTAGGSIRNLGCYPVSLIRLLAKAEPIEICGTGRMSQENHTDNQASVILKFADGALASVSTADDMNMVWQFNIYGSQGRLEAISNPWLPKEDNQLMVYINDTASPMEINVRAEKPLYTYQIDFMNAQIFQKNKKEGVKLCLDSLGNTIVLEAWLNQVKASRDNLNLCA